MQEYVLYQFNNTTIEIKQYIQNEYRNSVQCIYLDITSANQNIDSVKEIIRYLAIAIKVLGFLITIYKNY